MPTSYVIKRLVRSWQLYIALLLGIVLASTFFAGINVCADTAAKQLLDQELAKVSVDFAISGYYDWSSRNVTSLVNTIRGIQDVNEVEAISRAHVVVGLPGEEGTYLPFRLVGISQDSRVYDGWTNRPTSIGENQTYAVAGSAFAKLLTQGDVIQVNMSIPYYRYEFQAPPTVSLTLNLTVAGFAQFDSKASAILQGQYYSYEYGLLMGFGGPVVYQTSSYIEDILVVDWEETLAKFLDIPHDYSQPVFNTDILIYIDRDSLISVWDVQGSLQRLEVLRRNIENQINIGGFRLYVLSMLEDRLSYSQFALNMMRLVFVAVSLPVFFVAWYMGTTVSDVSFNLRRREIGLLLTKGFSKGQLFRMFLSEALLLGLVGSIIGIILSLALSPLFIQAVGGTFTVTSTIGTDTAIMTVIFGVVIIALAVFRPARRASNLPAVDALREYIYVEEVKPYKKRLPWVAFILGTYKLTVLALGINLMNEMPRLANSGVHFLVVLLAGIWAIFDFYVLTYLGPVLFFWGFTKIFIRGSLKFQEITAKAAKFLGDLGALATRNVQRNPARAAAVAFLIALIIGYGVQITGTLASDQDYSIRVVYASVRADVRVDLAPPVNASAITDLIKSIHANTTGVASSTVEYSFYGTSSFGYQQLLAVNTTEWLETAYYENSWFSGNDIKTAFQHLSSSNYTTILDRDTAERNGLRLNDKIRVSFDVEIPEAGEHLSADLTIVGFFGVKRPDSPIFGPTGIYSSLSYVPEGLFQELSQAITNTSTARILAKLTSGTDGSETAEQIRTLVPRGAVVLSVSGALQRQQSDPMYTGTLNVQRLGVAFAVLAASVGTALVTFVSLKEREREASMMSVRGLSFRQLVGMLLAENLAVVAFAVLLGVVAGLVIVYGNTVSFSAGVPSLVSKRLVFPADALLTIFIYCLLVFTSTILPVILMSKRYVSRLERVVREG